MANKGYAYGLSAQVARKVSKPHYAARFIKTFHIGAALCPSPPPPSASCDSKQIKLKCRFYDNYN